VAAGQLELTGGAEPIFFPNPRKTSMQLLLEAQQHKKYAQTIPLDDGVSSLFSLFWYLQMEINLQINTIKQIFNNFLLLSRFSRSVKIGIRTSMCKAPSLP
jgi:hypothetical protein